MHLFRDVCKNTREDSSLGGWGAFALRDASILPRATKEQMVVAKRAPSPRKVTLVGYVVEPSSSLELASLPTVVEFVACTAGRLRCRLCGHRSEDEPWVSAFVVPPFGPM